MDKRQSAVSARRVAFDREPAVTRGSALRALGRAEAMDHACERWAEVRGAPSDVRLPAPDAWNLLLRGAALARSAGDTDAAAALERYAGARPLDPRIVTDGSLLDAAVRGTLDRFEAESDDVHVRIVAFRFHRLGADARGVAPHAGVLIAQRRIAGHNEFWCRGFSRLRTEDEWPFDAEAAREALLAAATDDYGELHWRLPGAMLRRALDARPTSFAAWLVRDFRRILGGDAPLFAFEAEGVRCALRLVDGPLLEGTGSIQATFALSVGEDEREQQVYFDRIFGDDFLREAPGDETTRSIARAAVQAWRGALERRARSEPLSGRMPNDILCGGPFQAIRLWLHEGPPPPRPTRVAWTEETIERLLGGFRCEHRVETDERRSARARRAGLTVNVVDLRVGRHTLRFRIALDAWVTVELGSNGGDFVPITSQDSQAPPALVFAPIGDAIAFRDVCAALSTLVLRASADVVLAPSGAEDDEEDEEDEGNDQRSSPRRLTETLRFADAAEAWGLGPPSFDWRMELDFALPESPEEIALRLREDPSGRAAWEATCARYTTFITETLDPSFAPPVVPW